MNISHRLSRMIEYSYLVRNFIANFWDKNYFYAVGIKIVAAVQFMVLVKLVALNLSLPDAGNFFLMYNAALFISALFFSIHSAAFLRYYSVFHEKFLLYKVIIEQLFFVTITLAVILALVFAYDRKSIMYPVIIAYAVSIGLFLILSTKFRVAGQFKQFFYLTLLQNVILAGLIVTYALFFDLSPDLIIGCMAISIIASLVFYAVLKRNSLQKVINKTSDKKMSRALFLYGCPFVLVAVSNIVISTNGQFMLKHLGYADEVGVYAANYNIGEKGVFIWLSLVIMLNVPKIYDAYENDGATAAWRIIKNCLTILGVCGAVLLLITLFWSRDLSVFFANTEVAELGHWIIPGTVVSAVLLGFCSLLVEPLLIAKRSEIVASCYLASAGVAVGLGYLFISNYGLVGAVISPVLSNIVFLLMLIFCISKMDGYVPDKK